MRFVVKHGLGKWKCMSDGWMMNSMPAWKWNHFVSGWREVLIFILAILTTMDVVGENIAVISN
jgi:hypothetical protein